jgi:outer membrane protein assembly factor BamB
VEAPAGTVHRGPGGGVVVISSDQDRGTVTAFRRDGRGLWRTSRPLDCGNCDFGEQPRRRQPDDTYGPIGADAHAVWAVDRRGRIVPGCLGAVAPDGTCVLAESRAPAVAAERAGARLWRVAVPGYSWAAELDVAPVLVRDAAGLAYTAFDGPTDRSTGSPVPGLLVAVDPVARAVVWTRPGPDGVLAALRSGVLAREADRLVALRADGGVRWTRPVAGGFVQADQVAYDERRDRLYIGRKGPHPGVTALEATTGAQLWRTSTRDRARLLSAGARGPVYVAIDTPGATAVRAIRLSGATRWQRRTGRPVTGAAELADGTVAVSAGSGDPALGGGILTLLDPR